MKKFFIWLFLMWAVLHFGAKWGKENQAKVEQQIHESGIFQVANINK